jgi:hypothetical protein
MGAPALAYKFSGDLGMAGRDRTLVRAISFPLVPALADSFSLRSIHASARSLDGELSRYLLFASRVDSERN